MILIVPILAVQPILIHLQISEKCATKSTQALAPSILQSPLMQSLWKQLAFTHTLIKCLNRMIMLNSISTSSRIMSKNLFDLIVKLPANALLTLLTTPSRTTLHDFSVQATHHWYCFLPKFLSYVETSTSITRYLSKTTLLWSILSFTSPYSKDLLKVP